MRSSGSRPQASILVHTEASYKLWVWTVSRGARLNLSILGCRRGTPGTLKLSLSALCLVACIRSADEGCFPPLTHQSSCGRALQVVHLLRSDLTPSSSTGNRPLQHSPKYSLARTTILPTFVRKRTRHGPLACKNMSPSPAQHESDLLQLSNDPLSSFIPKDEDIGPDPFEGIMSAASSTVPRQGLGNVVSAFDPSAGPVTETTGLPGTQMQMQIDVLKGMSAAGASNVFLSDYPVAQQHQQQSLASMGLSEDMQGILPVREDSPASQQTASSNAASPAPGPFANISTSSLASALDDTSASLLARSRSGSLISPNALQSNGVTRTSPPLQSNESSMGFPSLSPDFPNSVSPPDPVNAPHMMVVDEFLSR